MFTNKPVAAEASDCGVGQYSCLGHPNLLIHNHKSRPDHVSRICGIASPEFSFIVSAHLDQSALPIWRPCMHCGMCQRCLPSAWQWCHRILIMHRCLSGQFLYWGMGWFSPLRVNRGVVLLFCPKYIRNSWQLARTVSCENISHTVAMVRRAAIIGCSLHTQAPIKALLYYAI